ncbi:hypothetical protein, partial [Pseudomonas aeruginosa]|uniref:hypothetical protein n=1 Tax=Pseudomonas aeruginosa TaxID=287 RepID=UPI0039C0B160
GESTTLPPPNASTTITEDATATDTTNADTATATQKNMMRTLFVEEWTTTLQPQFHTWMKETFLKELLQQQQQQMKLLIQQSHQQLVQ